MSAQDHQLQFLVKAEADLAALDRTAAKLRDEIMLAKALGEDSSKSEKKLKAVEAAAASLNGEVAKINPNFKINPVVDLRALKAAEDSLAKQLSLLQATGQTGSAAYKRIAAELGAVQAKMKDMGTLNRGWNEILGFAERIPVVGSVMRGLNGATGVLSKGFIGLGVAAMAAKKGLNEYAKSEEKVAGLDAVLAQNGLLTDEYRVKLQELAVQMQKSTAIATSQWYGVMQKLTQFGADDNNIGRYAEAVKNLAGVIGGDVETAAAIFSKALQGNLDALGRYGIHIVKTGDQTKDLDLLMQQLAQRGGGVLEARARSLNGQFRQLGNTIGDFFASIGRGTAQTGILQRTLDVFIKGFEYWAEKLGGPVEQLAGLTNKVRALSGATERSKEAADEMAAGFKRIGDASEKAVKELDRQTAAIKRLQSAQDELDDANMALELAKLDADDKIAEPDKLRQRAAIRERYARQKVDRANAADQETIAKTEGAMKQGEQQRRQSINKVDTQRERAREAAALDEDEGAAGARLQATLDALAATEKELAAMQEERARRRVTYGPSYTNLTPEEERDEAALRARLKQQQGLRDRYQGEMDGYAQTRKAQGLASGAVEREALKDAEKEDVTARTKIDKENLARAATIKQLTEEIALREKLYTIKSKTEEVKVGADVNKAQAAANKKQAEEQVKLRELQAKQAADTVKTKREQLQAARERAANPTVPDLQRDYMESPQAFAARKQQARLDAQTAADGEVAKATAEVAKAIAEQVKAQLAALDAKLAANPNATAADRDNIEYERGQINQRGAADALGATALPPLTPNQPDPFAGSEAAKNQQAGQPTFQAAQQRVNQAIKSATGDGKVDNGEVDQLLGLIEELVSVMEDTRNDNKDNRREIDSLRRQVSALRTN